MSDPRDATVMVVLTTAPDGDVAERLAETLLEEGLVACANLLPGARSLYRWKGELQRDAEVLMVMKTVASALPGLEERLATLHPYDVPELLALRVADGAEAYLAWVRGEVEGAA